MRRISVRRDVLVESHHQDSCGEAGGQARQLCLGSRWIYLGRREGVGRHLLLLVLVLLLDIVVLQPSTVSDIQC